MDTATTSDQESWAVELSLSYKQVESKGLEIAVATACILHQICAANDVQAYNHPRTAPFVGCEIPDIGVVDYCKRLKRYFNCSPSCFVTALMYIDQILTKTKKLSPEERVVLDTLTIHRLVLVSMVLAVKYHEDSHYSQAYYAQVGGVSLPELNSMERLFVDILEWDLDVNYDRFVKYFDELTGHPNVCQACRTDFASLAATAVKPKAAPPAPKPRAPTTPKAAATPKSVKTPKNVSTVKESNSSSNATPKKQSAFGKWTSSISLSVAATRAMFSDKHSDDPDASCKKKAPFKTRRDDVVIVTSEKENTSPTDEDEVTGGDTSVCEKYAELSLSESVGPVRKKSQHWHDACMSEDKLVAV